MKNTSKNINKSATSINTPARHSAFTTWGICLTLLCIFGTSLSVRGSMLRLAPEVQSSIFYVESNKENVPVVGVNSNSKVNVLLPGNVKKSVRYGKVAWANAQLPPVGRITVCKTEGASEGESFVSNGFATTMGSTYFTFDVVADRVIADCYVALILELKDDRRSKLISFAKLGDLPAGELVKKAVFFPNVLMYEEGNYTFEFFQNGLPLERFDIEQVADNASSKSLLIPWDVRLKRFLIDADQRKVNRQVRPFHSSFNELDLAGLKNRGIEFFKITLIVKKDGKVQLDKCDSVLSLDEQAYLKKDLENWQFLPAVKAGKPYDLKVALPVNL